MSVVVIVGSDGTEMKLGDFWCWPFAQRSLKSTSTCAQKVGQLNRYLGHSDLFYEIIFFDLCHTFLA